MDPNGHIYMDYEDKIPAEDKARLDGFLRGRAESDMKLDMLELKKKMEEHIARLES